MYLYMSNVVNMRVKKLNMKGYKNIYVY